MIVIVAVSIQLEQYGAHHGIRAGVQSQGVVARVEMEGTAPFEGQSLLQKITIQGKLVAQIEGMQVDHLIDRQIGLLGMQHLGDRVDGSDLALEVGQFVHCDEVGLVEDDAVGESDLRLGLGGIVQMEGNVLGVDQSDDAVEAEALFDLFVAEEGLGDGAGIGQAGGFDQHVVELVPALHELAKNADEVAANGAAKAPVVHFKDLFVGLDDQFVVDADLAEFVLDDGDALAVVGGQDAIEQGGLAGAEKAREDGHRDARVVVFGHREGPY